ncbi:MAG: biotin transporter BioY [Lachnospiraceae bacterium]|nr:biotin transporter BioY [Lachnospiraceae bacterium]
MKNYETLNIRMTVYCALFTALIIVGGYISIPIPIGPVPIVLADFFVMLAGLFLGFKYAFISISLYLALGLIGLPVFAGGTSGLAVIFGPTGGFIIGYILMGVCIGFITTKMKVTIISLMIALIAGNILLYLAGVPWLKFNMKLSWPAAITIGFIPFTAGIVIKIAAAVALGYAFLPQFKQKMVFASFKQPDDGDE